MVDLAKKERETQARVSKLFQNVLGYKNLGNLKDQENSNVDENLLKAYLLENDFARLIRSIMVDYLLICDWGSNEDEVVVNPQWKKFMKNLVNIDLSMEPKVYRCQ